MYILINRKLRKMSGAGKVNETIKKDYKLSKKLLFLYFENQNQEFFSMKIRGRKPKSIIPGYRRIIRSQT